VELDRLKAPISVNKKRGAPVDLGSRYFKRGVIWIYIALRDDTGATLMTHIAKVSDELLSLPRVEVASSGPGDGLTSELS
jgi:hypothetical protein